MEEGRQAWPPDLAVLVPVYNHAAQVGGVVAELVAAGATVLVVDDGSTDGSGEVAGSAGARVHRLPTNRGKGVALRAGFALLADEGYARVLTCDADGQHPISECLRLAVRPAEAQVIVIGVRDMAAAPRPNRCGRAFSNLWVRIVGGVWPGDSQSGLRIYPLPEVNQLRCGARRYHYEVEILVRAAWAGLGLRQVPVAVRYPADRVTHFRRFEDNLRVSLMFLRLCLRRLLPWPHRRLAGRRWPGWRALLTSHLSPGAGAAACGLGAAMGVAPVPGLQMLVAAWLATLLRLNVPLTLAASNISFGPLLAFWAAVGIVTGRALCLETAPWHAFAELRADFAAVNLWSTEGLRLVDRCFWDWLLGSLVLMPAVAVVAAAIGWFVLRLLRRRSAKEGIA